MATFSTVVFSFCQRECGFALGTILGMFVILPVRTIFRRFYSGYVAHYDDMWVCVRVHVWCGCVVLVAVAVVAGIKIMLKYNFAGTAQQHKTSHRVLAQHVVEPQQSIAGDDRNGMVKTVFVYGLGFIGAH